ncbi:uncharacterized protein K444DRAFT_37743 [Hyaloscypha bicolor E]|uniref:Uncharacterized protein n=1 Tax=Hyaloscypha bicolor E TaxID=1095630 RepID=A0A2J6T1I0_9HELO|nr:uncharacterized protein K444DRAFT_37743 [Hyaloscypha bicolor E]PMD56877.1 hypothetical protein K444DRAFT_37743 [Hyaloscypha bicolor E]
MSKKEMPAGPPDSYRSAFGGPLRRHLRHSAAPPSFPSHPLGVGYRPQSIAEACRACAVVRHASTPKSLISRSTSQSYEPSNWHTFQSLSQRLNWIVTVVITSKQQRGTCGPCLHSPQPDNPEPEPERQVSHVPRCKNPSPHWPLSHRCKAGPFTANPLFRFWENITSAIGILRHGVCLTLLEGFQENVRCGESDAPPFPMIQSTCFPPCPALLSPDVSSPIPGTETKESHDPKQSADTPRTDPQTVVR